MAIATGTTTTSLLAAAKISPDQYGLEIAIAAANKSVMLPLIRRYNIGMGNQLFIPKVGTRSATKRVRGTDDGNAIVASALSSSGVQMTKTFAYDALKADKMSQNDMPPDHLAAWLRAEQTQIERALANQIDSDIIGLYSGAANTVGSSAANASYTQILDAIQLLRVANAPGPFFMIYPETQWSNLAKIPELSRFDVRGEGDTIVNRQAFRTHGVDIFTTGNVPVASATAHGLAFSGEGLAISIRNLVEVEAWYEKKEFTNYVSAFSDYAFANTFTDWIVDVQNTSA